MNRVSGSIRAQLILVTIISLLVLAVTLEAINLYQQEATLTNSERRVGLTLIRSVNNTISTVRSFISTLSDIAELDTRLAELVQLNDNIDFITVTDTAGNVIFHSNPDIVGTNVSELADLPTDTTIEAVVPVFGDVLLTAQSFDSDGLVDTDRYWIIVASAIEPISNQLVNETMSSILVTGLFTLIVGFMLIVFLQRFFVRPLEQLTEAANAIEAGNLSLQVNASSNNEIGQLARGFNRMTQQLAALINTLEERVKERTHELESARDQAEQASRAKSDFLSNMSHELRTPLNMVIGYTSSMLYMPQMYNNAQLPEVFREDIELIRESGKHLLSLINDILDLSKVEAGKLVLNFTAIDLVEAFDSAIAASLGLTGDKPVQVRQDYSNNLPLVWADNVRVRQILLNLLSNAIKYTNTGSVTLFAENRGDAVGIAVIDTGPGIPQNALSIIFDRFQQLQHDTEIQGTGLGLDISQRLAHLHGTEITIDTELGRGSTFAFTLPIATPEQLAQQASQAPAQTGNVEIFAGNAAHRTLALMIAKDSSFRQPLRRVLESSNIVVTEAKDTKHAFELASGLLPDVILLDCSSHDTGYQALLDQLQGNSETQQIPVILITEGEHPPLQSPLIKTTIQKAMVPHVIVQAVQSLPSDHTVNHLLN